MNLLYLPCSRFSHLSSPLGLEICANIDRQDATGLSGEHSEALLQDLTALFKAMSDRGGGAALDRPFSSPYYWAGFQVQIMKNDVVMRLLTPCNILRSTKCLISGRDIPTTRIIECKSGRQRSPLKHKVVDENR